MTRFTSLARRPSWGIAGAVLLIHALVIVALIRAFTPDIASQAVRAITQTFNVDLKEPLPPTLSPTVPEASRSARPAAPKEEGSAGKPGRIAVPGQAAVPPAKLVIKPTEAPPVAASGDENAAGVGQDSRGSGAAGQGNGIGAGKSGAGAGGGGAGVPTVKIAGEINSARDYPRGSRSLRIGASVVIDLTVGTNGQVTGCRVVQASPDPEADRITCELATRRFRFRPALDTAGVPIRSVYRWRQRWFYQGAE